jgi:ATP-dependent Clp protease ATP-binding subunit ClpC
MDKRFHIFVRHHAAGMSAALVNAPHLCSFAVDLDSARADLARVLVRLMRRGQLVHDETYFADARLRRVDVVLRALQEARLIEVPMRFSVLTYTESVAGTDNMAGSRRERAGLPLRVLVPRLELDGQLRDPEDLEAYVEELIRHELHLAPLGRLLEVAYTGRETLETMVVAVPPSVTTAAPRPTSPKPEPLGGALGQTCRRLSDERASGILARAYERAREVAQLDALLGARASVLLVGPPGVGKTCLVHELVHRAAEASASSKPEIFSTSAGRIIAGMRYLGEWQERLGGMLAELRERSAVLHFESLSELLSVGRGGEDGLDLPRFLLPAVEAGEVSIVIEAAPSDVVRAERSHAAFVQALHRLVVDPLSASAGRTALAMVATRLARARSVRFEVAALERAMDLAERFGTGALPGAAVELLEAAAHKVPARFDRGPKPRSIAAEELTAAFCARTGYPGALVDPSQPLSPVEVKDRLRRRVLGQDVAIDLLTNLVVTLKSNLADPERPLGSFLLLGPTGVGKTESALALADLLFGDEKRMARFDMAEYAAPGSAARLLDARTRSGSLAHRVREQPFGVVLLDEIEKADASVLDLLLQILGEGRLSDSVGHTVSFRNTIVILTSNLGAETAGRFVGFGEASLAAEDAHYRKAAAAFFRPELLNRFDQVVPYRPLGHDVIRLLARRVLEQALAREGFVRRGITVLFDEAVVDRLMQLGFDPRLGARPLRRAVELHVVGPVAEKLGRESVRGDVRLVVEGDGKIAVVTAESPQRAPAGSG